MSAPTFRYHPDPVSTGSAIPADEPCSICGEHRGLRYRGPIFGNQVDNLCMDCIASGRAAEELDASGDGLFTDGYDAPESVPREAVREITHCTPGFYGWQQEHWMYHCDDGAAFLGPVGYPELRELPDAVEMLLHENDQFGWTAEQSQEYVTSLHRKGDAVGYLFRCLHCGTHLAFTDMS